MMPILFSFGPVVIHTLSVVILLSWLVFSFTFWKFLREKGVTEERIFDLTFTITLVSFIGSRLVYVLFHMDQFSSSWLTIPAMWVIPGLSLYGALLSGLVTILILTRGKDPKKSTAFDAATYALLSVLPLGFFGAFLDGSVVGKASSVPWALPAVGLPDLRHPVSLYACLSTLICFIGISLFKKRLSAKKYSDGFVASWVVAVGSVILFVIEFFRENSVYWLLLSPAQWFLIGLFSEAAGFIIVKSRVLGVFFTRFSQLKDRFFHKRKKEEHYEPKSE